MVEFEFKCNDKLEFEFLLTACRVVPASSTSAPASAALRTTALTSGVYDATLKEVTT